jgi:2-iminobutanoate/2-iminopropanoate deaminase
MTANARRSVNLRGHGHANPIPAASRIGSLLMSSVISGRDLESGRIPSSVDEQCAHMFRTVRAVVEAEGGTPADIIKMTVWLRDPGNRDALNAEWLSMFPDAGSRPARHALPLMDSGENLIQCDFTAVLGEKF